MISERRREPSMQDVADVAGVSRSAVSLVLNNRPIRISEKKRRAIHEAAKRLGFRPHVAALRLKRNTTDTLRLVFPHQSFA
jgi:LacI family transcriptional regulator